MDFLFLLAAIFVIINIIQVWLILHFKSLIKGGIIVGLMEAFEFCIMIYLLLKKELAIFFLVVSIEILEWLSIAYFSTKNKIK
jgi:hypothetical protein